MKIGRIQVEFPFHLGGGSLFFERLDRHEPLAGGVAEHPDHRSPRWPLDRRERRPREGVDQPHSPVVRLDRGHVASGQGQATIEEPATHAG